MGRLGVYRWTLATLIGLGGSAGVAGAASVSGGYGTASSSLFKTGDVEKDMPSSSSSVTVIPGHAYNYTAEPQWMKDQNLVNGYAMKDIRLSYDKNSDTLSVGVNFYGTAMNTDGSPDGQTNPMTLVQHGSNPANFGADKSITLAFSAATSNGVAPSPTIVAGVPSTKTNPTLGPVENFTVAAYKDSSQGLTHSYGQTLSANVGSVAYNPSSAHPDFEFTIKNFSKIPGLNALQNGYYVSAYAGSQQTVIVGKSDIVSTFVKPGLNQPQNLDPPTTVTPPSVVVPPVKTPEPTTIMAWGLIAGGAAWRFRRRTAQT